jgi:hypothetical protein
VNLISKGKILDEGKVLHFHELDSLIQNFNIIYTVIDANPERRMALEFCQRFYGHAKMCFYNRGITGKEIVVKDDDHMIGVDRTSWLDLSLSRFRKQSILLPRDLSTEYRSHIKAPVRVYEKDADGNPIGRYKTAENDGDHLAHARTYNEIALRLAVSLTRNEDIRGIL